MAIPKVGWNRPFGELMNNADTNLFGCVSYSLFGGMHTTTYKYCFFKSLLDNIFEFDENYQIGFKTLSATFATIYWNSIALHEIPVQKGFRKGKLSSIELLVNKFVEERPHMAGVPFDSLLEEDRRAFLLGAESIFSKYVVGAFYEDTDGCLYGFSKKEKKLWLDKNSYLFLTENKELLDQVNYYRWLKEVEKILKDAGEHRENLSTLLEEITQRTDLTPFKESLMALAEQRTCFYCGKKLTKSAHLDHVIPWSFLKTDALWNFVFACPHCNESKNNRIPSDEFLKALEERNHELGISGPSVLQVANTAKINGVKTGWAPKGGKDETQV